MLTAVFSNASESVADVSADMRLAEAAVHRGDPHRAAELYREALRRTLGAKLGLQELAEVEWGLRSLHSLKSTVGSAETDAQVFASWAGNERGLVVDPAHRRLRADIASLARRYWGRAALAKLAAAETKVTGGVVERIEEASGKWAPLFFLSDWSIVGPFDNERGGGFLTEYPPESAWGATRPETTVDSEEGTDAENESKAGNETSSQSRSGVAALVDSPSFKGKTRPVRWRRLPARPLAGRVNLSGLLEPRNEALAYALTFVKADAAKDVILHVGAKDGFRIWLNRRLVSTLNRQGPFRFDQHQIAVRLRQGWNAILCKFGQSSGTWNFAVRLSAADGTAVKGLEEGLPPDTFYLPFPESEKGAGATKPKDAKTEDDKSADAPAPRQREILVALSGRLEDSGGDPVRDARLAYLLGVLQWSYRPHDANEHPDTHALELATQVEGRSAVYFAALARTRERQVKITAERDENAWRRDMEKAAALGSVLARCDLADYYLEMFESPTLAAPYVRAALQSAPSCERALSLVGELEATRGYPLGAERARRRVRKLPRRSLQARAGVADSLLRRGQRERAVKLYKGLLSESPQWGRVRSRLSAALLAGGDVDAAVGVLKAGAQLEPHGASWHLDVADVHMGGDNYAAAIAAIRRALDVCPDDASVWRRLGEVELRRNQRGDALHALRYALRLQPNSPDLREYLELLETEKVDFAAQFRRDGAPVLARAKNVQKTDDPARILLELNAIEVNPDGTTQEYHQSFVKILNDRGIRLFARHSTAYQDGEQRVDFRRAVVHHPDGSTSEARVRRFGDDGGAGNRRRWASVDLPPLTAGDVVEVEYVREDLVQSFFGDYFGHREVFQSSLPIDEKVLILRVPEARQIHLRQRNLDVKPAREVDADAKTVTYTWVAKNIPKIDPEPGMPSAVEVAPVVEASTFESWMVFSEWYWNLIRDQFEGSPAISKKVRELTSGAESDLDKIRAVYNYVVTDIRYNAWEFGVHGFKPYNAATIYARKFGDCKDKATLLSVMLKDVGIQAHPVLIRATHDRHREDLTLPLIRHFNHCITFIPGNDDRPDLFLDGTATLHSVDDLPSSDRGAKVLIVDGKAGQIRDVPWNRPDQLSSEETAIVTLGADLSAEVEVRVHATGDYAVFVRQQFEIATQRERDLERILTRRFAGAKLRAAEFSALDNLDEPVQFMIRFTVPKLAREAPEGVVVSVWEDFFSSTQNFQALGSLEKREFDVLLGNPRRMRLQVTYRLPETLRVKSIPEGAKQAGPFGRLNAKFVKAADTVTLERELEVTSQRVPFSVYESFREFAVVVARLQEERIVLQRS